MTHALTEAFPDYRPYAGEHQGVIPHLTVAHGSAADADEAAKVLRLRLEQGLALEAQCNSVAQIENSSGRWSELCVFQLPQRDVTANLGPIC